MENSSEKNEERRRGEAERVKRDKKDLPYEHE